jgi:predicted ATP-dependent endonuclease of OLD family
MMTLKRFRVTNFKSVEDSGWIETDDVTALIGTNEAGKTNILLPLWKFNPAKEGSIVPTSDYPRKHFNTFRHAKPKPVFITTVFEVDDDLGRKLSQATGMPLDAVREVQVARRFDGQYEVDFPDAAPIRAVERQRVAEILQNTEREIAAMSPLKTEEELKKLLSSSLRTVAESLPADDLGPEHLESVLATLERVKTDTAPKTSTIVPRHKQAVEEMRALHTELSREHPRENDEAVDLVVKNLPKFVFYSTYGNLDSEIYLPHVIANLARTDLGTREQAKARTLKVLFEFVRLKPEEILELGRDFPDASRQPTEQEVTAIAEKKKQRSILLQSASALLTQQFRDWWKQGEYRFRFEADGNHFRIWVSDDKRPEEIELEGRSTGLQWFLSFYLVFLVERADAHDDAILLLDEPGLSLHPLAQRDLSEFFDGLAKDNQLLYTCHSPFLVDADRLDRARKVYVGADGTSKVTADLRAADGDVAQRGAAYAVHAAVGLSVAESLLLGCDPVVVEGPSDQHCLTAMKTLLIAAGRLKPGRELVFPPAGGTKGVRAVSSIVGGRDEVLPLALFDSDSAGRETAKSLRETLYAGEPGLVLEVATFTGMADSEVEDLIPADVLIKQLDRWQRAADVPFADLYKPGTPIVPQIEAWAAKHGVVLTKPGWKPELAKRVKQQLIADGHAKIAPEVLDRWQKLFVALQEARTKADAAVV